jgi:enoyl-CoA hydratase/carnithine racemase
VPEDLSPRTDVHPALAAAARGAASAGIRVSVSGRRVTVTLDRASTRNAQTPATWRALTEVGEAVAVSAPGVVVLRAEGPSFSAGLDRAMFTSGPDGEPGLAQLALLDDEALDAAIAGFQRAFTWWREVDAVTVAAVGGHAVGAGFQLALACDLRVVADDVALAMRETSLGLVPDLAGTLPLVGLVGYPRALEVCATGRRVGAEEAVRLGLAEVTVPRAELDAAADDLAAALLEAPGGALAATKALLRDAHGRAPAEQQAAERRAQAGRLRELAASASRR